MDVEELTWREQEVLGLLSERLTNREIAVRLHLAESTVKEYVSNILGKLYVKNRRQAVTEAKKLGLLVVPSDVAAEPTPNLPIYSSPIVGRVAELQKIKRLLHEGTRLLTLSGPGGAGKTRLAIEAAEEAANEFEQGSYLVSLAPLQSPDQIVQAIAEALNFPLSTYEDAAKQLIRFLQKKQLLLVMDNFEHLMDGAAILEKILRSAAGVKVLATSRERLSIQSEVTFQIGGMGLPDGMDADKLIWSDAIVFFVQCARRARLSFSPSPSALKKIAAICEIVQGIPLAIELAAAWLHILSLDEIKTEIEQSFDILSEDLRVASERHRSIRNVFEHSWSMLDPNEQEQFMLISIFRDGFTRRAAQQIAGTTLSILSRLVNKSVLKYDPETRRFAVHELLRQYGQEQLEMHPEKQQAVLEDYAAYYAEFMQEKWGELRGRRQLDALVEINADLENIRLAWSYYVDHASARQLEKFLNSFWLVYWIHGWNLSAVNLFEQAVKALSESQAEKLAIRVRAHAMAYQAFFLAWLGLAEAGYSLASESIDLLRSGDDPIALYFAYHGLTLPAYYLEKIDEEKYANDQMLMIACATGDKWLLAFAEFLLSITLLRSKDFAGAEHWAAAGLNHSEAIEDLTVQALSLNALGHVSYAHGAYQKAKEYYLGSLRKSHLIGFRWAIGNATKYLGQVALISEDLIEAERYFLLSLGIADELGLDRDIANHLVEFARLRAAQDRVPEAVAILGMLLTLPVINQARLGEGQIKENAEQLLAQFGAALSADALSESLERGKGLDLQEFLSSLIEKQA